MAIQSLFGPTPAQVMEMRRKEQEQEIMQQGKEFGVFAPLYQAGLRFGEQGRQSLQGLFPGQQDSALKEATAVQSVLAKYADSDQTDPEVLSRIGRELMPIAPNAGLKALTIAKELQTKQESIIGKVNPSDFTPASLQAFIQSGGKDYSLLKEKAGTGEGTEFERLLQGLPPDQQQKYRMDLLRKKTSQEMPPSLVPIVFKDLDAVTSNTGAIGELRSTINNLESGKLKLGLNSNFANTFKTLAGKSTEGSRAYSEMNTMLESLRNARLNLNTGVQTEGDALRAINEFLSNFDKYDTKTALQQFKRIEDKMALATNAKQDRVKALFNSYGTAVPEGFFPKITTKSENTQTISDSVIQREFNDPKNAAWKARGFDAFKKEFLKRNQNK